MPDVCPYLEYRQLGDETQSGDATDSRPRAYCNAAEEFVQAMRADVCNDRYGLDHEADCEIFREAAGPPEGVEGEGAGGD
ncbi:hypothetical protein M0R89_00445 [Halorussus limi]|uniref:Uncharacterized protein n=1 Tax=Halorussus limi TaxID=2938695 RepID=A0A8U0HVA1_9EURY|nr:hypothetical protein [Halorussus limi]UPV74554.1 hypothetical protein M0R89_00445 [Halorussus limi]